MTNEHDNEQAPPTPPAPLTAEMRERLLSPGWAWLTGPVKDAYEQRGASVTTITIEFSRLPEQAAAGYASVLRQRSLPTGTVRANVSKLDAALLGSALGRTSRQLLGELFGPLPDRSRDRAQTQRRAEELWADALGHPALQRHTQLAAWIESERVGGKLPADIAERSLLLKQALTVLEQLPSESALGLAQLGWRTVGNTKALTTATPLRAVILRALAAVAEDPVPSNADTRAALWERFGATANPLVSQVLAAGFVLDSDGPVATALRLHATAGMAMRLTLEQVLQLAEENPSWPSRVFIVENPEVLSATVAEIGAQHPPTLCTEGRPHRAADTLVDLLVAAGSEVYAHNDFDWDGLAINRALQARGARPWRMSAADLQQVAERHQTDELPMLTGNPVATPWEPELQAAIAAFGSEIHEEDEAIMDSLLDDLRRGTVPEPVR